MRRGAAAAALLVALACAAELPGPLPRVVETRPSGVVSPDAVSVELAFSAPLDPKGIEDGARFALCRKDDLRDVLQRAESDAGLDPGAPVVPARRVLSPDRTRATLTPLDALAPNQAWAAVLSKRARSAEGRPVLDVDGHARSVVVLFETGPEADRSPPQARWIVPPHGPVPADVAALRLAFDEPVTGALAVASCPGARPVAVGKDVLGLELGCALGPGPLALDLSGVQDLAGNLARPPQELVVSPCASSGAPAASGLELTPGELSVRVVGALRGMGRLVAEVSALPGDGACGAAPSPPGVAELAGEVLPCPGWDPCSPLPATCPGLLEVRGICPGRAIQARVAAEDLAGHRGAFGGWIEVAALAPRPAPVLTEVLADAEAPEAGGEYAEVANVGTGEANLEGWALAKRTASGALTRCKLAKGQGDPIPPGGHALVVGGAYDGRYQLPERVALYRCGTSALAGGLANDRPVALALEDPSGQAVSTVGLAEPAPRCATGALERIHPSGPDAAQNLACPGVTTPGSCNRSTPQEECPHQPW